MAQISLTFPDGNSRSYAAGVTPAGALHATTAAHVLALRGGAHLLRVHDVRPAVDAIAVYEAMRAHDPYGLPEVPLH